MDSRCLILDLVRKSHESSRENRNDDETGCESLIERRRRRVDLAGDGELMMDEYDSAPPECSSCSPSSPFAVELATRM